MEPVSHQPEHRDPLWYKSAVIYQAHVRSFADSDANGIGDFRGLTARLDYLQDLGVTAVWLLPFYPSPLRDDGYDIADYYRVHPTYGTLADFKLFLREAHRRGLRVITELVINHTSDQHEWFKKSRRARAGSRWRDFYVWSETPDKYRDARIIFKDFEPSNWSWDPVANAYYWHRFYAHQPDLNFDHPEVHEEILRVFEFWLDMGVDGMRLDAIPYLYEREGTNCENLPETHAFLKRLRERIDTQYGDRLLLAEANQWPEDSAAYFGQGRGDECHMAFHFPLMPRLFMSIRLEDRTPIVDILEQTPSIPETSQWAIFLRNHDELTLEMVTDEERDYMYRVYARDARSRINLGIRRRLAPLLGNDRKRVELLSALLMSMPGTPVIYYGDEIGMGDNIYLGDRNGVRTPMQWSSDKNAGFSRANPQSLFLPIILDPEYHYEAVNVEAQQRNPHSLLWWTRRLLALRQRWRAFGRGTIQFIHPENRKILAFVRRFEEECILVVCNLSRFVQPVELDLSAYAQTLPIELFGRTAFPPVTDKPYLLTLGPHAFYWFALKPRFAESSALGIPGGSAEGSAPPGLSVNGRWETILDRERRGMVEGALLHYIQPRRWFGGKAREVKSVRIQELIPVPCEGEKAFLVLLEVDYIHGDAELYQLPLAFAIGAESERLQRDCPHFVIIRLVANRASEPQEGILYDATAGRGFGLAMLGQVRHRRALKGGSGTMECFATSLVRHLAPDESTPLEPSLANAEQSNSALLFGDRFILKTFRRLEPGRNPDIELSCFLAEKKFPHMAPLAGGIEYTARDGTVFSLGILSGFVANCQNAWNYTLDALGRFYDRVNALPDEQRDAPPDVGHVLDAVDRELPALVGERLGTYIESARLLGERTAALHLCLGSDPDSRDFAPEPFSPFYLRSLFQSMRNQAVQTFALLRRQLKTLPETAVEDAGKVLALEAEIIARLRAVTASRINGMRLRIHGDYHLGQVLQTGKDFLIIDFEGEPTRPVTERRIKRTPLRDVAGMLRSFHYAAHAILFKQVEHGVTQRAGLVRLEPWARYWTHWTSVLFLKSYLDVARPAGFLPAAGPELKVLLDVNLLHKAIYELAYELNTRPAWVRIPLRGILQMTGS